MKYLSLTIPQYGNIAPPPHVPYGGTGTLSSILGVGFDLAVTGAIIVCLFVLLLGGFGWITSEGDKQKVAQARQRLVFAIIGLAVVFASALILNVIYTFFFGTTVLP